MLNELRSQVETAAAGGGLVFKPYVDGERIAVDCVPAWRFLPTAFNSRGEVTGAVFVEQVTKGKTYYTRMEHHQLTDDGYTIRNLAYSSLSQGTLGNPCSLAAVEEWADLEPEMTIRYKDGTAPEGVLFAYFRLPFSNTVDPESPLGVSVYSRAVGLIREADRQYSRILWEYEGSELAIDASQGALQVSGPDGRPATLPPRSKRLFRELAIDQGQSGDLYKVFNPAIRDTSLFNGLDKLLKRVRAQAAQRRLRHAVRPTGCGQDRRGNQEQQAAFLLRCAADVQRALQSALEHLVWVMDFYASLYKLAPMGEYEVNFTWGDGVLQDTDKEYMRRKELVDSGYLSPEKLLAWYFGISEDEAKAFMPAASPPLFGEE